jgi:hypothetical protein
VTYRQLPFLRRVHRDSASLGPENNHHDNEHRRRPDDEGHCHSIIIAMRLRDRDLQIQVDRSQKIAELIEGNEAVPLWALVAEISR